MIYLKNKEEIQKMRSAAQVVVEALRKMRENVVPGVSTWDLDRMAEDLAVSKGAKPAFKGYSSYPASVCFAVNSEVVHGIPSKKNVLKEGDIVGLDFGVILDGFYGDSAITVPVGSISSEAEKLLKVTEESLMRGIKEARPGNRLYDISAAIQNYVEEEGFSVVRSFVGHGIGKKLHEDPQVPNFVPENGNNGRGLKLKPGMVMAIEPMVNVGRPDVKILNDGWTAVTVDGTLSAHFEHTVAVTENGPLVLTQ
ncbi:MAG: type I methionyl aminopeptidase [Candidatus Dadabacteria bacterium]|jgi:methionyl aminopeptidase|nr:type I methionyl aminopeptidase [Candidatus Dadabacteria bacterium]